MNQTTFLIFILIISTFVSIITCNTLTGYYKWEDMLPNFVLPDNPVFAGQDVGPNFAPLFVVRGTGSNYNYYGKLPLPYSTRYAYLTNENVEFTTPDFQILTAGGYAWCKPSYLTPNIEPICRARHNGLLTPGTHLGNRCRIGFYWTVHFYYDYEVLTIGTGCA